MNSADLYLQDGSLMDLILPVIEGQVKLSYEETQ